MNVSKLRCFFRDHILVHSVVILSSSSCDRNCKHLKLQRVEQLSFAFIQSSLFQRHFIHKNSVNGRHWVCSMRLTGCRNTCSYGTWMKSSAAAAEMCVMPTIYISVNTRSSPLSVVVIRWQLRLLSLHRGMIYGIRCTPFCSTPFHYCATLLKSIVYVMTTLSVRHTCGGRRKYYVTVVIVPLFYQAFSFIHIRISRQAFDGVVLILGIKYSSGYRNYRLCRDNYCASGLSLH